MTSRRVRPLARALAVSAALHAAVLLHGGDAQGSRHADATSAPVRLVMAARLVPAPAADPAPPEHRAPPVVASGPPAFTGPPATPPASAPAPAPATAAVAVAATASSTASTATTAQADEATYATAGTLDVPPRLLSDVDTDSAPVSEDGRVVLRVRISADGQVDAIDVLRSYPRGLYDAAALAAFRAARYAPARQAGRAVRSQVIYEIDYLPINRGTAVSGQ